MDNGPGILDETIRAALPIARKFDEWDLETETRSIPQTPATERAG
jgi:hypothetical protein